LSDCFYVLPIKLLWTSSPLLAFTVPGRRRACSASFLEEFFSETGLLAYDPWNFRSLRPNGRGRAPIPLVQQRLRILKSTLKASQGAFASAKQ
jgi:hypothetical protein